MLRKEDFMVIHALAQRGLYVCDIAKQVGEVKRCQEPFSSASPLSAEVLAKF